MSDKPPTLTDLVRHVKSRANAPASTDVSDLASPARRRGWTSELPALAKKYGQAPLTVGMAIVVATLIVRTWDLRQQLEDRIESRVAKALVTHSDSSSAHALTIGRLTKQVDDARARLGRIEKQLIELRAELKRQPRRRRR